MTRTNKSVNGLVFGVGVNDSGRSSSYGMKHDPIYRRWYSMLQRCYSNDWHEKYPTYIGCSVCEEWLVFSNFKKWLLANYVDGYQLDKDLLDPTNKIYCPEKCLFVPQRINKLVIDCGRIRGDFPIGVCYDRNAKKFKAQISGGKQNVIGWFNTPEAAHIAWLKAKREIVLELKPELDAIHPDLYEAIMSRYPLPEAVNNGLYFLEAA